MTAMAVEGTKQRTVFLSTLPAERRERRLALTAVLVSVVIFLAAAPFAKLQLAPVSAFIPIYESALVINDLVTAVFLFGQFYISRWRALLLLACGYLFSAAMAVPHALTFPGLFAPTGLLGAGPQSTAWLYMFWHAGFPLLVIAYALRRDDARQTERGARPALAIAASVIAILLAASAFTLVATVGHDWLPTVMRGDGYTPALTVVIAIVWGLSLLALLALAQRRPYAALDLWLMVVMCAWLFDVALSGMLNHGRFDLGFYAGRIYGLMAASFVLVVLLLENSRLYAQLIEVHASERRKAAELERLSTVDALTGIANRRAFDAALDQEWRRMLRHKSPLCLLLIDVDHFKRFNDGYGHLAGDQCLQTVATAVAANARRAGELAARYGGEEFAVLLPQIDLEEACRLAQRICQVVRDLNIRHEHSPTAPHVTISIGVASALHALVLESEGTVLAPDRPWPETRRSGAALLVKAADQALYAAKAAGRNRAVSAHTDDVVGDMPEPPTNDDEPLHRACAA